MLLHAVDTPPSRSGDLGHGPPVVVLLHGMMGSSESWWRVVPFLTARGHRVLAIDLPGHGLSPRDPSLTIEQAAASVVETIAHLAPGEAIIAVGHSYGATVLAEAAQAVNPHLAVYVDAGLALRGGGDRHTLVTQYERDRQTRMSADTLRAIRPFYSEKDAQVEARAASRFDPETMASISCGDDHSWIPEPGSILVHAQPSAWVSPDDLRRFASVGVQVRGIVGAAHSVWFSHFAEFTASLPELFGPTPDKSTSPRR